MSASEVDRVVRRSLERFFSDVRKRGFRGGEREAISLYALSCLAPACRPGSVLSDPTQIGIEAAVPHPEPTARGRAQINRDLVIWPRAGMTLWNERSERENVPLAVMEWRAYGRRKGDRVPRVLQPHWRDVGFLVKLSQMYARLGRRVPIGYAVAVDLTPSSLRLVCARVARDAVEEPWLVLPARRDRSA
jgi:hypothetical protein